MAAGAEVLAADKPLTGMWPELGHWLPAKDGDHRARALFDRHYSRRRYADGRKPAQFVAPGEKMVLLTVGCDALFVWVHNTVERLDHQVGVVCTVFRNESDVLSSVLILEAEELAWCRWPGERLFTYVDPAKVASRNPGYCFLMAGWRRCKIAGGGGQEAPLRETAVGGNRGGVSA